MTISKEIWTTMSHWGSVPRTGLASFLMHLCAALVYRVAFPASVRRASRVRRKVEKAKLLASFWMHLCAALVHRDAFFGRNFGAVFEHAKTLIREEHYTAMSHWGMVPRAGLASFLRHLCAALVHREAFLDENSERFLSRQKRSFGRSITQLCHTGGGCPARGWRHF